MKKNIVFIGIILSIIVLDAISFTKRNNQEKERLKYVIEEIRGLSVGDILNCNSVPPGCASTADSLCYTLYCQALMNLCFIDNYASSTCQEIKKRHDNDCRGLSFGCGLTLPFQDLPLFGACSKWWHYLCRVERLLI